MPDGPPRRTASMGGGLYSCRWESVAQTLQLCPAQLNREGPERLDLHF